ncbi:MAG: hypothetical protein OXF74_09920 [Rhodobacteraceae bacterium]|nr:hypothetical protein [Paracoccaceae bacterium]
MVNKRPSNKGQEERNRRVRHPHLTGKTRHLSQRMMHHGSPAKTVVG